MLSKWTTTRLVYIAMIFIAIYVNNVYANGFSNNSVTTDKTVATKNITQKSKKKTKTIKHAKKRRKKKTKPVAKTKMAAMPVQQNVYHRTVAHFDGIEADGNFNIELVNDPQYRVEIKDPNLNCIKAWVDGDGLLILSSDKDHSECRGNVATATISMPNLAALYISGSSSVSANNIRSQGLVIEAKDESNAVILGTVNLTKLSTAGDSNVSVRWVDSHDLELVEAGDSQVSLAGVTGLLQARLLDNAELNAKYLRAKTILVHTQDKASADVLATHYLYAFADDHSNIYYFKSAKYHLESSHLSGNVLQMAHWR